MCSDPIIFAPLSGDLPRYSSRVAMRPGISCSARRISLRPHSASERSATLNGGRAEAAAVFFSGLVAVAMERMEMGMRMGATAFLQSRQKVLVSDHEAARSDGSANA